VVKNGIVIASRGYQYEFHPPCDEYPKVKVVCIKKCKDDCFGQYLFEPPRMYLSDPLHDFAGDWIIWIRDEYGGWDYWWVGDEKYRQCFRKIPE